MAEPESAVLPITPYPIGFEEPQVSALHTVFKADEQTTKR
jgi:hypothetical protein